MPNATALLTDIVPARAHEHQHRLPVLDGVRGFAVLYVILFHFYLTPPADIGSLKRIGFALIDLGFTGVDLFFVLSGFLITGILLANTNSENYFSSFYARRILRIFPLYYLLCLVSIVIIPSIPFFDRYEFLGSGSGSLAYYWFFLNNLALILPVQPQAFLNVCWSLSIEEQFYLLWPLAIWLFGKRGALRASVALFVLSVLLRNTLYYGFGAEAPHLYGFTFTHIEAITIGSSIAIMMTEPARYARPLRLLSMQWVITGPLLIADAIYFGVFPPPNPPPLFVSPAMVSVGYTLSALAYGGLLLHCLTGDSPVTRLLGTGPMRQAGKYSYAMYLLHVPAWFIATQICIYVTARIGTGRQFSRTTVLAIGLPLTYLFAAISWRFLESKANALKDHFPYRRPASARS